MPERNTTAEEAVGLLVYLIFSPQFGPGVRCFSDEDLLIAGGVHSIERDLEKECYWFVRIGEIAARLCGPHVSFQESDLATLPAPPSLTSWKTGRQNPAFGRSELHNQVFTAVFEAIRQMLDKWKRNEDGVVDAYALRELHISPERLSSLTSGLQSLERVHEVVKITVVKHWHDASWPEPHFVEDFPLAEFSFAIPLQVRWSAGNTLVFVDIPCPAAC